MSNVQEQHWFLLIEPDHISETKRSFRILAADTKYGDFLNESKIGDKIWFISRQNWYIIGVATYNMHLQRVKRAVGIFTVKSIEEYNATDNTDTDVFINEYYSLSYETYIPNINNKPVLYTNTIEFNAPVEYNNIKKRVRILKVLGLKNMRIKNY